MPQIPLEKILTGKASFSLPLLIFVENYVVYNSLESNFRHKFPFIESCEQDQLNIGQLILEGQTQSMFDDAPKTYLLKQDKWLKKHQDMLSLIVQHSLPVIIVVKQKCDAKLQKQLQSQNCQYILCSCNSQNIAELWLQRRMQDLDLQNGQEVLQTCSSTILQLLPQLDQVFLKTHFSGETQVDCKEIENLSSDGSQEVFFHIIGLFRGKGLYFRQLLEAIQTRSLEIPYFLWWLSTACQLLEKSVTSGASIRQLAQEYKVFHSGIQASLQDYIGQKFPNATRASQSDFFAKLWDAIFLLDWHFKEFQEIQAYNTLYDILALLHQKSLEKIL